jgi:hypothetical protein
MAERTGFTEFDLVLISPLVPLQQAGDVKYVTWPDVYAWLRKRSRLSNWARHVADFMEILETRMAADGRLGDLPLTRFDGIPFCVDYPYSYLEAKRILKLAMPELRKRKSLARLGMDPDGEGRSAITGRVGSSVWDFLPLRDARGRGIFTACPHLTLSIQVQRFMIIVTLPNGVEASMRRNLVSLNVDGFCELIGEVERGVSKAIRTIDGAAPIMEVIQRHYPSQRSAGIEDARLEFDLRTAIDRSDSAVKAQHAWLQAAHVALKNRAGTNLQLAVGASIPYGDAKLQSRDVLDVIEGVWLGCQPWIARILQA